MSEVEKMYEKAEPNRNCNLYKHFTECPMKHTQCEDCENFVYPPFTAEKQLELIKLLGNINIDIDNGCYMSSEILKVEAHCDTFEETLAEFVNNLWQDLTEEERKQIRNILEQPLGAVYKIDWMYVRKVYPYFLERRYWNNVAR